MAIREVDLCCCPGCCADPYVYFSNGTFSDGTLGRCDTIDTIPGETIIDNGINDSNGATIEDITIINDRIYFPQFVHALSAYALRSVELDGTDIQSHDTLVSGNNYNWISNEGSKIFLATVFDIYSIDDDGSNETNIYNLLTVPTNGMICDGLHSANGKVYFTSHYNDPGTDGTDSMLCSIDQDGTNFAILVADDLTNWVLDSVHATDNYIYVHDRLGDGRIIRFDLNGSNETTIFSGNAGLQLIYKPFCVAESLNRIYFMAYDTSDFLVYHCDLDGSNADGAVVIAGPTMFENGTVGMHVYEP